MWKPTKTIYSIDILTLQIVQSIWKVRGQFNSSSDVEEFKNI